MTLAEIMDVYEENNEIVIDSFTGKTVIGDDYKEGIAEIYKTCEVTRIDPKNKQIFIKAPDDIFALSEMQEVVYHSYQIAEAQESFDAMKEEIICNLKIIADKATELADNLEAGLAWDGSEKDEE